MSLTVVPVVFGDPPKDRERTKYKETGLLVVPPLVLLVILGILGLWLPQPLLPAGGRCGQPAGGAAMNSEMMLKTFRNGGSIPVQDVPLTSLDEFLQGIVELTGLGWRIASYFCVPDSDGAALWCVLAGSNEQVGVFRSRVEESLPSITAACPEAHLFEREIAEQSGIALDGHPWFKPVRYHPSLRPGHDAWGRQPTALRCSPAWVITTVSKGRKIHEVAVGPVHAGIIEPGHFRFQCHGENVYHLEIALGYQHRGLERSWPEAPMQPHGPDGDRCRGYDDRPLHRLCHDPGGPGRIRSAARAESLRGVALELERLANHCGDLGALAGDVGFLPTMSFCGRIRGDFLNASAALCGSRFGGASSGRAGSTSIAGTEQAVSLIGAP